jgi:hypothetical protein
LIDRLDLSRHASRARWIALALAWLVVALLAVVDARAERDYVTLLDESGMLPTDSLAMTRPVPANYADAQTWTRYAVAIEHGAPRRLHFTHDDNAPAGRAVHWNTAFMNAIALAGRAQAAVTGEPVERATERALAWFNLPLLLITIFVFSAWVTARSGAAAGVLIAFGMIGNRWFYDGFAPNYVDHHGLLTAASFGVVLGATFMGAGWWRRESDDTSMLPSSYEAARRGAIVSAVSGGIGVWISAASVIPTIAFVGVAGVIAAAWVGRATHERGAIFNASLWRLWGRIGAITSLAAYLLEYGGHLGLRMEVTHPLYALAWLAGGELVAIIGEWCCCEIRPPRWRAVAAAIGLLAAPLTIVVGGAAVFTPLDPGLARLHEHIAEFQSLASIVRVRGVGDLRRFAAGLLLVLPALFAFRRSMRDRVLLAFLGCAAVASVILACIEVRWWLAASAPELCLLFVAVVAIGRAARTRWMLAAVLSATFVVGAAKRTRLTRRNVAAAAVTPADAMEPLYRDVAVTLRRSQPAGAITLLANPDASTAIGYYGGYATLGTFYWENRDGLAAAAEMLSAPTDAAARGLLRRRGVTHVVLGSYNDFLIPYLEMAHPGATPADLPGTFGFRLLVENRVPRWLRPVPFALRPGSASDLVVRIFQVVPDQTERQAAWDHGVAAAALGDTVTALRDFSRIADSEAADRRASVYEDAGQAAYREHGAAAALRLFARAMALEPSVSLRLEMAWILATSVDDGVRDGAAAVALLQPVALSASDDAGLLDVLSAALAEQGRFAEAITLETRAASMARAAGQGTLADAAARRLESYKVRRPWRQW